ncbi:unnamed protein product, partial [marine sediment metagenome]
AEFALIAEPDAFTMKPGGILFYPRSQQAK